MSATGATRAMVWKEARENLKWAALAFVGTAGTLLVVLQELLGWGRGQPRTDSPLTDDGFLAATTVCAAAAALLLGLTQTLPEKRPDQWAFLVHRPVSRTRLFLAKALTGLGLYFVAVGLPFACAVAWVAMPGHMGAPFDAGMAQPALADLLGGVPYYFAGIVIGMREARWYGSRVLAAALAGVCSAVVVFVPSFWHAVIAVVVAAAVLGTAAWGLFRTGGGYARLPVPAKAGLGTAVLAAILLLGMVAVGAAGKLLPRTDWEYVPHRYLIDPAGRVVRSTQRGANLTFTDPKGNPLPEYAGDPTGSRFEGLPEAHLGLTPAYSNLFSRLTTSYRGPRRYFLELSATDTERWYYVYDKGYIIGYRQHNGQVIGYLTPAGFHPGPDAPADRFVGEEPMWAYSPRGILAFRSVVYKLNLTRRQIVRAFASPAGDAVVSATPSSDPAGQAFDAVLTSRAVTVLSPEGQPRFTVPLEHGPAEGYTELIVAWREVPGRYYLLYQPSWGPPRPTPGPDHLVELSPAGEVLARRELPPLPPLAQPLPRPGEAVLVGAASPPAGMGVFFVLTPWLHGERADRVTNDPELRRAFVATVLSGLACAALTLALARRYAFGRRATIGWTVGNLLLGPAGVLTMLAIREWPARERCPSCGRGRVVDRDHCPHCAATPEPPPLDGTEIFAT